MRPRPSPWLTTPLLWKPLTHLPSFPRQRRPSSAPSQARFSSRTTRAGPTSLSPFSFSLTQRQSPPRRTLSQPSACSPTSTVRLAMASSTTPATSWRTRSSSTTTPTLTLTGHHARSPASPPPATSSTWPVVRSPGAAHASPLSPRAPVSPSSLLWQRPRRKSSTFRTSLPRSSETPRRVSPSSATTRAPSISPGTPSITVGPSMWTCVTFSSAIALPKTPSRSFGYLPRPTLPTASPRPLPPPSLRRLSSISSSHVPRSEFHSRGGVRDTEQPSGLEIRTRSTTCPQGQNCLHVPLRGGAAFGFNPRHTGSQTWQ
mmetsp:Transcript_17977/g.52443  ORF Transcript_17977/g.52443 Transcript_17977/m.52443 type:complete len:316 (-) Transcript_17977:332-1279(-)